MRGAHRLLLYAVLIALGPAIAAVADQASLSIEGHVKHPRRFDLEALRKLPAETVLRHVIKVTGRDGYVVVLSTGEIAPEFGGKPALIAYQRDGAMLEEAGFRLVMPGDKRGGRNVRDVVTIAAE